MDSFDPIRLQNEYLLLQKKLGEQFLPLWMNSFSVVVMLCSMCSAVLCLCLLRHLILLPRSHRRRLFWSQLVALAATDFTEAIMGVLCAHWPTPSPSSCIAYIGLRYALEFSSCMLEVQIAAGFAAVCCHSS